MAQKSSGSRSGTRRRGGSSNGRSASQKTEEYRFAQNVDGKGTMAEREYRDYATRKGGDTGGDPDVLLDIPVVKVDKIHFQLEDLDAHLALQAKVLDLLKLNVGVDVHLGKVRLDIEGVEAQALVKVRLDHVAAIVDRVLTTIDRNPELIESLGQAVEDVGSGAGDALGETGEAVEDVGQGAGGAVQDVGQGAGQAVGDVGEGASDAVGQLGQGAGEAVGQVGEGGGQAVGDVGEGAGQAVGDLQGTVGGLGETVGQAGQGAGQAAGGVAEAAGQAGQAAGGLAGGGQGGQQSQDGGQQGGQPGAGGQDNGGQPDAGAGQLAKVVAKTVAHEIGSAATDEMKDLGTAAARKARELGDRRRQRRAEKHNATPAALKAAKEGGVDLDEVEGTGAEGRITVKDVREAAEA